VFASTPASAKKVYVPGITFGGLCTSSPCGPGQLKEPIGVAVNDSELGDVYVVDKGNNRVERFSATGKFEGEFNGSGMLPGEGKAAGSGGLSDEVPTGRFSAPEQVAVDNSVEMADPSKGDVYVTDTGHNVIDKFSATGAYLGQVTLGCTPLDCSELTRFKELRALAVDPQGNLWVYGGPQQIEGSEVIEYSATGSFKRVIAVPICACGGHAFAVDSQESFYVTYTPSAFLQKFKAAGGGLSYNLSGVSAVAIGPSTNALFVDKGTSIEEYGPFGEPYSGPPADTPPLEVLPSEGLAGSSGLAVSSVDTVYASERSAGEVESFDYVTVPDVSTQAPTGVSETGLTLHGDVNPEGEAVKECYFEYGTQTGIYTNRVECEQQSEDITGSEAVPVSAQLSGLSPADARSVRLVAVSPAGLVARARDVTISRPAIGGESLSGVGSIAATVGAQVDPGGLATTYSVEYGTSTTYGSHSEPASLSASSTGTEALEAFAQLTGLQPETVYHLRVVASNALGTSDGNDFTLTTFPPPTAGLPDGRVYELASSPPGGHDVDVYVQGTMQNLSNNEEHGIWTFLPFKVAPSGEAVAYPGDPPVTGGTGNVGGSKGDEYLARRLPGGGWTQAALEGEDTGGYVDFSSDLSIGVLAGGEIPGAGSPLGYYDWYTHPTVSGIEGAYRPFFTATPDRSSQELNFAEGGTSNTYAGGNPGTSAVPAFTDQLFETNAGILEGEGQLEKELDEDVELEIAEARDSQFVHYLYDTVAGRPYLIDVLPDGKVAPRATFGSLEEKSSNGYTHPGLTHAISADGSRVFWTWAPEAHNMGELILNRSQGVYVRENPTQPQSPLNGEECTVPTTDACTVQVAPSGSIFQTASADGSKVFFTNINEELYEYDLETGETIELSPGVKVAGVAGTSEDGEYVYYVDSSGSIKLWHEGAPTLVAAEAGLGSVPPFSGGEGGGGYHNDYITELGSRTAEVTPDGHSLIFMSQKSLTGYDNMLEGKPLDEVFLYEATTGKLTCISCNASGEPPVSVEVDNSIEGFTKQLVGAFFPLSGEPTYQPQSIIADGSRVFFDSAEPLVPQAKNGWVDVYEWERDGMGSCQSSRGCIYLLSGGAGSENSYLIGPSANGDDVFFISRAQLIPADRGNDDFVVYDARVDGNQPPVPSLCSGTGCQGVPPPPPIFATPASVTFAGAGNFPPPSLPVKEFVKCKTGRKLSHGKCVKAKAVKRKIKRAKRAKKVQKAAKKVQKADRRAR
jgi:hypothetical protein